MTYIYEICNQKLIEKCNFYRTGWSDGVIYIVQKAARDATVS